MAAWATDLTLRDVYGLCPTTAACTSGRHQLRQFFAAPNTSPFNSTRLGPGSDQAAGWASSCSASCSAGARKEARSGRPWRTRAAPAPVDPADAQLPLWFLARGTRNLYARSAWGADAYWTVFTSAPRLVADHQHPNASNFVFARGATAWSSTPARTERVRP